MAVQEASSSNCESPGPPPTTAKNPHGEHTDGSLPVEDELPLSVQFHKNYALLQDISENPNFSGDKTTQITELVRKWKRLAFLVERGGVFSSNEELEDISTQDLKYLLVPWFCGNTVSQDDDIETRAGSLNAAVVFWQMFLSRASRFNLVDAEDQDVVFADAEEAAARARDANRARTEKISRFKRESALKAKIDRYFELRKTRCPDDDDDWGQTSVNIDEDQIRQLFLDMLSRAVIKSIEDIDMARKELPMLEMMAARGGRDRPPMQYSEEERRKPWQISIRDPTELHKLFKDSVFQPDIPMPTVTLDEYAQYEMDKVQEQKDRENQKVVAEYTEKNTSTSKAVYDQEAYAEREEEERNEKKQRDWDDWVDLNPKGAGNKMGNIA